MKSSRFSVLFCLASFYILLVYFDVHLNAQFHAFDAVVSEAWSKGWQMRHLPWNQCYLWSCSWIWSPNQRQCVLLYTIVQVLAHEETCEDFFFPRSLLYKLLFLKKSRIMQSRFARKAPCFIHAHLDIKVNISEVSMELPHPGFGYTKLFSLIFSTVAMRECEVLRDNV